MYTPFTYNDVALDEKPPITKQNLRIIFFVVGGVECTYESIINLITDQLPNQLLIHPIVIRILTNQLMISKLINYYSFDYQFISYQSITNLSVTNWEGAPFTLLGSKLFSSNGCKT